MIVKWPGVTGRGSSCGTPVHIDDFVTTILAMARVEAPAEARSKFDGLDVTPLMRGEDSVPADRPMFWHYPHVWGPNGPGIWPFTAVRVGDWKLVYVHADRRFELFNIREDIGEKTNLADKRPDKVRELAAVLDAYIRRVDGQLSIDKETGKPIEMPLEALAKAAKS